MRSNSRFFIEDPSEFLESFPDNSETAEIVKHVQNHDTTILQVPVNTESVKQASLGKKGSTIIQDYRGVDVLSAYRPVNVLGLNWILLAEIDADEAFAASASASRRISVIVGVLIFAIIVISLIIGLSITLPLHRTTNILEDISEGEGDLTVRIAADSRDELGRLSLSFDTFVGKLNRMVMRIKDTVRNAGGISESLSAGSAGERRGYCGNVAESGFHIRSDSKSRSEIQ